MEKSPQPSAMRAYWDRIRAGEVPAPRGRGHWPKGKRQHALTATQLRAIKQAARAIQTQWEQGLVSKKALAAYVGVDDKSVARWLSGRHYPSPQSARKIAEWVKRLPVR